MMERKMMEHFTVVNPIIKATNLKKVLNFKGSNLIILDQIDIEIAPSQTIAIMGPSGAGKTTLLSLVAGLDTPTSGKVILGGVDIFALNEDQRAEVRRSNIGFIFQNFYLLENLTAIENVMLPLELLYDKDAKQKASELLRLVGLEDRMQHLPRQLSGGEQQRVAIARAFVTMPKIVFADEPTGNLDQKTGESIIDILFSINNKYNTTLVIVSHDHSLANRCNKIINISRGKIN